MGRSFSEGKKSTCVHASGREEVSGSMADYYCTTMKKKRREKMSSKPSSKLLLLSSFYWVQSDPYLFPVYFFPFRRQVDPYREKEEAISGRVGPFCPQKGKTWWALRRSDIEN